MQVSNKWASMLVVIIGTFMAILDGSIVNVALPKIMAVMSASPDEIQWILTSYMLTMGVVMPISGYLGDVYGTKKIYLLSLASFTIGSAICGIAWNLNSLIIARVLQGLGGGIMTPISMAIIYRTFDRSEMGMALGIWGIASMAAPAIGPTLGGYLVEYSNWRLIFLLNLPIGIINLFLGMYLLRESVLVATRRFDFIGIISATVGFASLLYALSSAPEKGWGSLEIIALLILAFFSLIVLVINELNHTEPILDLRLFKNPVFAMSSVVGSVLAIGLFGVLFLIPLFLQTLSGLSAMQVGLVLMPMAIASGFTMPISGFLFDRIGARPLVVSGLLVVSATTYWLSGLTLTTPLGILSVFLALRGVGMGLSMMPANTVGMNTVPPPLVNRASALSNLIRQVAAAFGVAIFSTIMQQRQVFHFHNYAESLQLQTPTAHKVMSGLQSHMISIGASSDQANAAANGALITMLQKQSMASAINDCLLVAVFILLIGIIPSLFLVTKKAPPPS